MRRTLSSKSFSTQKAPVGKASRDNKELDDLRGDVDAGFVEMELYTPVILTKTHANHATETVTITAPFDLTVLDAYVVKTTAVGADNGDNTVTVQNAAAAAITDEMSIRNKAVGAVVRAASYTVANANVDKDASIKILFTRANAGDNNAATVYLSCIRR